MSSKLSSKLSSPPAFFVPFTENTGKGPPALPKPKKERKNTQSQHHSVLITDNDFIIKEIVCALYFSACFNLFCLIFALVFINFFWEPTNFVCPDGVSPFSPPPAVS